VIFAVVANAEQPRPFQGAIVQSIGGVVSPSIVPVVTKPTIVTTEIQRPYPGAVILSIGGITIPVVTKPIIAAAEAQQSYSGFVIQARGGVVTIARLPTVTPPVTASAEQPRPYQGVTITGIGGVDSKSLIPRAVPSVIAGSESPRPQSGAVVQLSNTVITLSTVPSVTQPVIATTPAPYPPYQGAVTGAFGNIGTIHLTVTRNLLWNVYTHITVTRDLLWNVSGHLTVTRSLLWNVAYRLAVQRQLLWVVNPNADIKNVGKATAYGCNSFPDKAQAFTRVYIDQLIRGATKVFWELDRRFNDPLPYTFQLQTDESGIANADDWINVGTPVTNAYYATDPAQRLFGKQLTTYYRLKLTTSSGTYYSLPTQSIGNLTWRDWHLAREITRKEMLRLRKYTAILGYLLIAKRTGIPCDCTDPLTNELTLTFCTNCYGTGFVGGYYPPLPCVFFDVSPESSDEHIDMQGRGQVDDIIKVARYIGYPHLRVRDVFVARDTDRRYYINKVKNLAEIRGMPVITEPTIHAAPFSDVIYTFVINAQGDAQNPPIIDPATLIPRATVPIIVSAEPFRPYPGDIVIAGNKVISVAPTVSVVQPIIATTQPVQIITGYR